MNANRIFAPIIGINSNDSNEKSDL